MLLKVLNKKILGDKFIFGLFGLFFARHFMVAMPVFVIFVKSLGFSNSAFFLLQAYFSLMLLLLEIPTGYLADKINRKTTLIFGTVFAILGTATYGFSNGFFGIVIAETLLALSAALYSGANSAILYDYLLSKNKEKEYTRYEGKLFSVMSFSEGLAAIASVFFVLILPLHALFWVQTTVIILLGIPSLFLIREPLKHTKHSITLPQIIKFILREHPFMFLLQVFASIISVSTWVFAFLGQAFWKDIGTPEYAFGAIWAIANILVGLGALIAHRINAKFNFFKLFLFFTFTPFLLYFTLATLFHLNVNFIFMVIFSLLFWIFRGIYNPIFKDYINKEVSSEVRATTLSAQSFFNSLAFVIFSPFVGFLSDYTSYDVTFFIVGLLFSGILLLLFLFLAPKLSTAYDLRHKK